MGLGHSPAVVSEGLVFYFDPINTRSYAGTGLTGYNLIDTSATGSLVGGAVYDVANRGSIYFDGVNDYINFATQPISDNNSISISCWVKFATIPSTYAPIIDAGNVGLGTSGYCISFDNARKIYMAVNGGFTNINFNFNANTWYHITGTAQQATPYAIKVYVNGAEAAIGSSGASNTMTGINSNIRIGSNFVGSITYLNFNIASLSIYNRALSSTEVLQNYNATKKRFSPEENIVKEGLVFHIDAAKSSSYPGTGITALNIAGVGATGVLINGVGFGVSSGGSFIFDGTNDYIDCGTDSITNFVTTTMSAEIMFQTTGATTRPHLIGRGTDGSTGQFVIVLENTTPPKMRLWLDKGSGWAIAATGSSTILNNQWYHVVGVYDGTNAYVYLNGTLDASAASTGTLRSIPSNSVTIGYYVPSTSHYLTGKIPFARLYNKALSSTEVLQNYNALKGRYGLS